LIFNEGYSARSGVDILGRDLAEEAIRLAKALCDHGRTARPQTQALLALMLLHVARFEARVAHGGALVDLWEQDRARWDRMRIQTGLAYLQRAATGDELTSYHLEAMIAACHARAASAETTNWALIADFYDKLFHINPSPEQSRPFFF
jgi:RNA polymerase sigma-70 factor (ECF subfamily)